MLVWWWWLLLLVVLLLLPLLDGSCNIVRNIRFGWIFVDNGVVGYATDVSDGFGEVGGLGARDDAGTRRLFPVDNPSSLLSPPPLLAVLSFGTRAMSRKSFAC